MCNGRTPRKITFANHQWDQILFEQCQVKHENTSPNLHRSHSYRRQGTSERFRNAKAWVRIPGFERSSKGFTKPRTEPGEARASAEMALRNVDAVCVGCSTCLPFWSQAGDARLANRCEISSRENDRTSESHANDHLITGVPNDDFNAEVASPDGTRGFFGHGDKKKQERYL